MPETVVRFLGVQKKISQIWSLIYIPDEKTLKKRLGNSKCYEEGARVLR